MVMGKNSREFHHGSWFRTSDLFCTCDGRYDMLAKLSFLLFASDKKEKKPFESFDFEKYEETKIQTFSVGVECMPSLFCYENCFNFKFI